MGFYTIIVALFLLQHQFVNAGFTKKCLCPHYIDTYGLRGYCGKEILEKRALAKPSTRNCKPNFVYFCDYGPNGATFELNCEENQTCIQGSEAFKKLKNNTDLDYSNKLLRFCASYEGKTNLQYFFYQALQSNTVTACKKFLIVSFQK